MSAALFVAAVCVIVTGFLLIFNKGMAWRSAEERARLSGLSAEPNNAWEANVTTRGVLMVILGVILLLVAFGQGDAERRPAAQTGSGPGHHRPSR